MEISDLAHFVDDLAVSSSAVIVESIVNVSVSNLSYEAALRIAQLCNEIAWSFSLFDEADEMCVTTALHEDFAPFRAVIVKPSQSANVLPILTVIGLNNFLQSQPPYQKWYVASLEERIVTRSNVLCPWNDEYVFDLMPATKNPRSLVREYASNRKVPSNISPWLLRDPDAQFTFSAVFSSWLNASVRAICRSLVSEIDAETETLRCNGTPKLSIVFPEATEDLSQKFSLENFKQLQVAASWVFDNEREAESKHVLLAAEIARAGHLGANLYQSFGEQISSSLSSAKIAYQMMLSDLSKDTLKALSDLRKAVTEETAKMTDVTRQLIGGVSAAMAVGFGLIAARMTTSTSPWLIAAVMLLVSAYVGVVIYSGVQFISIQRQLRIDWQSKLYRFLPPPDYEKMVMVPTGRSEHTFFVSSWIGGASIAVLTVVVLFICFSNRVSEPLNNSKKMEANLSAVSASATFSSATFKPASSSLAATGQPKSNSINLTKYGALSTFPAASASLSHSLATSKTQSASSVAINQPVGGGKRSSPQ